MLGGEHEPAMFLACWMLGHDLPVTPETFTSKKHHCEVNLHAMISFLTKDKSPTDYHSREFFQMHQPAIEELALGQKLRDRNASECVKKFYTYVKHAFFTVCTNTQLVERWVKDANECFATGKDEHFSSLVGICRSATVFEYKNDARIEAKQHVLKGNRYFTEGRIGERIDKRTRLVENEGCKNNLNVRGAFFTNLVVKKTKDCSCKLNLLKTPPEGKKATVLQN